MKKLISKIRNKRLKGNVSLLVIFVLLATSVISLLSINQIQRLLTYGNMTFNYFRAFYLAKAGNELGLTEVYNSENGFNHRIESGSAIITGGNLLLAYSGFNPYFDMTITGNFKYLTNNIRESDECENENKIKLTPGAGIMLALFSDETDDLNKILSDDKELTTLNNFKNLSLDGNNSELTFAFFTYNENGEMTDIVVETGTNLGSFLSNRSIAHGEKGYLTIKNPSDNDNDVEFCVYKGGDFIPYSDSLITVFGHYGDMEVGLQSVVKKGVPDWTLNVLDEWSSS